MTFPEFAAAILVLLATPGPTNTLLSLAGWSRGPARALPLLAGEIGGYLTVIVPVALLAGPFLAQHPAILPVVKLGAGLWVLLLAYRLWRKAHAPADADGIGVAQVYVTTVLNPKAPIIALVIMPHGPLREILPWLAAFAGLTIAAGTSWILAGSGLGRAAQGWLSGATIRKAAALCLVGFSMILTGTSIRALV